MRESVPILVAALFVKRKKALETWYETASSSEVEVTGATTKTITFLNPYAGTTVVYGINAVGEDIAIAAGPGLSNWVAQIRIVDGTSVPVGNTIGARDIAQVSLSGTRTWMGGLSRISGDIRTGGISTGFTGHPSPSHVLNTGNDPA